MRLPTHLDRYPAKMVSKLADRLIRQYAAGAERLLDPFCGSGAVLVAAHKQGIPVVGVDINPVAALFCSVKLKGFDPVAARAMARDWIGRARGVTNVMPVLWDTKDYWFTKATLNKFERLRASCEARSFGESCEGNAVLLSYSLAARLCSRADQRSPKPFISKLARQTRSGRHFDPYRVMITLLDELSVLYGQRLDAAPCDILLADVPNTPNGVKHVGKCSHVVTSPPYINAQDYFRNFKLELYLLEGILPFQVRNVRERFVGTERGHLLRDIDGEILARNVDVLPELFVLQKSAPRLAAVVHRYLRDMEQAFMTLRSCLCPEGRLVLVCGDNLIGGIQIRTWQALQRMLEMQGFRLFDQFADHIGDRLLPPKRNGHKGLIKEEVVSAFRLSRVRNGGADEADRLRTPTHQTKTA